MKVHLIRHAEAVTRTALLPDEYRALTCRGRKKFRQVAASLKKSDFNPDLIITSSKIRAVQTADILAEGLQFNSDIIISPALSSDPGVSELAKIVSASHGADELVIVGHEPALGMIVSELLALSPPCQLSKGSVVSMKITLVKSGLTAELCGVVTGSGKIISSPGAALEWLKEKICTGSKGER